LTGRANIGTQVADDLEFGQLVKGRGELAEAVTKGFRTRISNLFDDAGKLSVWKNLAKGEGGDSLSVDDLAAVRMLAFDELLNPSSLNWNHLNEVRGMYHAATNDLVRLAKRAVNDFDDLAKTATRTDEVGAARAVSHVLRTTVGTIEGPIGPPKPVGSVGEALASSTSENMKFIMDTVSGELGEVLKAFDGNADDVFRSLWSGGKPAFDKMAGTLATLPAKERRILRHSMIMNLVDPQQNGTFDAKQFVKVWNSLDDRVKNLMLPRGTESRIALDSLGRLSNLAIEAAPETAKLGIGAALFNGSLMSTLGLLGALKTGGISAAAGMGAARAAAAAIGSPRIMKWMMNSQNPFAPGSIAALSEVIRQADAEGDRGTALAGMAITDMLEGQTTSSVGLWKSR
jgi:hypothetical protein